VADLTATLSRLESPEGGQLYSALGVRVHERFVCTPSGSSTLLDGCDCSATSSVETGSYITQADRPQRKTVTRAVVGTAVLGPVGLVGSLFVPKKGKAPAPVVHKTETTSTIVTIDTPHLSAAVTHIGPPAPAHQLVTALRQATEAAWRDEIQRLQTEERALDELGRSPLAEAVRTCGDSVAAAEQDVEMQRSIDTALGKLKEVRAGLSFADQHFAVLAGAVSMLVVLLVVLLVWFVR
jgi:hypothetical protein